MVGERGIYRRGLHKRQGNRETVCLGLAPKRLRESLHCKLRGAVSALIGNGHLAEHAADIDDGTPELPEVLGRDEGSVHDAPIDDVEKAPLVLNRHFV
jgi:hypothetical protein